MEAPMPDDNKLPLKTTSRRGRKQKKGTATSDFLYFDAFELYQQKLTEFALPGATGGAGSQEGGSRESPSFHALAYVLHQFGKELGNIGAGRLRNIFSEFQRVRDWEPPDRPVEHEEAEAAWEAQEPKTNFRECNERPAGVQRHDEQGG
jgi:hypothetical protein